MLTLLRIVPLKSSPTQYNFEHNRMQFGVLQCGGLGNSWGSEEVGASLGMFTRSADKSRQPDRFPHSQAADDKDDNTSNVSS